MLTIFLINTINYLHSLRYYSYRGDNYDLPNILPLLQPGPDAIRSSIVRDGGSSWDTSSRVHHKELCIVDRLACPINRIISFTITTVLFMTIYQIGRNSIDTCIEKLGVSVAYHTTTIIKKRSSCLVGILLSEEKIYWRKQDFVLQKVIDIQLFTDEK